MSSPCEAEGVRGGKTRVQQVAPLQKLLLLGIMLLLALIPFNALHAQEPSGVIREANPFGSAEISSFNPLRCQDFACDRVAELLFPLLFGVDHETHLLTGGTVQNNAAALSWETIEPGVIAVQLRDDLQWSDGVPLTAYDVFFTYDAASSREISSDYRNRLNNELQGIVPLSETELLLYLRNDECDVLPSINLPIIPVHVFNADFAATTADFFADGSLAEYERWQDEVDYDFSVLLNHPWDDAPSVSSGKFTWDAWQRGAYIRLRAVDGELVYEMVDAIGSREEVDGFLAGDSNIMIGLPYSRWVDVLARDDLQVTTYPGTAWEYLAFNLEDPRDPHSAFDEDGNPQEQSIHPILGDVRVRQAVQRAINVQAVIDAAANGYGQVMAADQVPLSFAFDPSLQPIGYDPVAAEALLEEAGWYRYGSNRIRQCRDCLYAEPESRLFVNLYYASGYEGHYAAARVIAQQLQAVGFEVNLSESNLVNMREQRFDLYLAAWGEPYPIQPDHTSLFTPSSDLLGSGNNITSYNNPEVTALLDQARTLPGCAVEDRAALYAEAQRILQQDQPYVWLFTYEELYAASDGVQGFAPAPEFPFWNVEEWIVWR